MVQISVKKKLPTAERVTTGSKQSPDGLRPDADADAGLRSPTVGVGFRLSRFLVIGGLLKWN